MTSKPDRISVQRREKLEHIRAHGINPYPNTYHRTYTAQEAVNALKQSEDSGQTTHPVVNVAGRIMARRGMGKIAFFDLRDGSGKIQILFGDALNKDLVELSKELDIGDIMGTTGRLFRTRSGEPTVAASEF